VKSLFLGLWQRLRGTPGSATRRAAAVAIGLFIGCQPLYGLHFVLVLAVCLPLRLDAVLAYLAANISNPIVAPFLIVAEVEAGSWLLTGKLVAFDVEQARATGAAGFASQLFIGSLAVGALLSAIGFGVAWLVVSRSRRDAPPSAEAGDELERALERTRARYRAVAPAHRYYVAGKLAFDPVVRLLYEVEGPLGRVLDLGCGRGQLSLLLLELGRASAVLGIDADADKIAAARIAGPDAEFEAGDLAATGLPRADTILLIDVLHYLPEREQDELLARAVRALEPGGRLLLRELDAQPSARGKVTRLFEWCGRKIGLNRGRATQYRPAAQYVQLLARAGLHSRVQGASERTPFANVLIVAGSPVTSVDPAASASSTRTSAANA
jgi:uncharacterized protein (DUF2062 family)/SAM-dependent methyltransferase